MDRLKFDDVICYKFFKLYLYKYIYNTNEETHECNKHLLQPLLKKQRAAPYFSNLKLKDKEKFPFPFLKHAAELQSLKSEN